MPFAPPSDARYLESLPHLAPAHSWLRLTAGSGYPCRADNTDPVTRVRFSPVIVACAPLGEVLLRLGGGARNGAS